MNADEASRPENLGREVLAAGSGGGGPDRTTSTHKEIFGG